MKKLSILFLTLFAANAFAVKIKEPAHDISTYCATTSPDYPWANDDCIAAYTNVESVAPGGTISFKVHTNPVSKFSVDIYRMGWDAGTGSATTWITGVSGKQGKVQPVCPTDTVTGQTECAWTNNYSLTIPTTWKSGVYLATLSNATGWNTEVLFVVKRPGQVAQFTYVVPTNTYAAYNNYPRWSSVSGKSFYDADSTGANTIVGTPRAVRSSFNRPLHHQFGSWLGSDWSEVHLVAWLEKSGYNIKYITDTDFHNITKAELIKNKGIIFGGHSEYWTRKMYTNAELARDNGVSLAFFGANGIHWQVRLEPATTGVSNRSVVCYKDTATSNLDPITNAGLKTKWWRNLGKPEQTLMGVQHPIGGWNYESVQHTPMVISDASSMFFNFTNLTVGDSIPFLTGYEVDNFDPSYAGPVVKAGTQQMFIATSPFVTSSGQTINGQTSIYQAPSGAYVFSSGTISYSWALAKDQDWAGVTYQHSGIQQLTKNILDKFITK